MSTETTNNAPPPAAPDWAAATRYALIAAVVGLVLFLGAGFANMSHTSPGHDHGGASQFFLSWLVGWIFWLALPVGGMALLMIHYLAKSSWGRLLSRLLEAATKTLPLMFVLFLPVAYAATSGKLSPYWWTDPNESLLTEDMRKAAKELERYKAEFRAGGNPKIDAPTASKGQQAVAIEHELTNRREGTWGFLTPNFFVVASLGYFLIWGAFVFFLNKWSAEAQADSEKVVSSLEKAKNISGPGLIVYAITITAAVSHWVMSLEVSWSSTMFPVIFAVESFLIAFAFCLTVFLTLADRPPLKGVLRSKFQLDMGTLMLAFTLFWSYTSFSQMMLIWIGNLPEEIPYYLKRSNATPWWWVSLALIVFHFALPFLLLLFRDIKKHPKRLRAVAVYLLVVCAIDVAWWIEPIRDHHTPYFIGMDVGAILAVGGLWGLGFVYFLKQRPLLPENQLYMLPEGHDEHH